MCGRRRDPHENLALLGISTSFEWEGLSDARIEAYLAAKDALFDALKEAHNLDEEDEDWPLHVPPDAREPLRPLLLQRAVALVHVLLPLEKERPGIRKLKAHNLVTKEHWQGYEHAEELCAEELKAVREESKRLSPESPPDAIIHVAVRLYQGQGRNPGGPQPGPQAAGDAPVEQAPPPFKNGQNVRWATGDDDIKENEVGEVVGGLASGRVRVKFKAGTWAFHPNELLHPNGEFCVPREPPEPHPDATEVPVLRLRINLERKPGEPLGLDIAHINPPAEAKGNKQGFLLIKSVGKTGCGPRHNTKCSDAAMRLRDGDRILACASGQGPEGQLHGPPVSGDTRAMLDVLAKDKISPLVLFLAREKGPALRFKAGQRVLANCGKWLDGTVVELWADGQCGEWKPYTIKLDEPGGRSHIVTAPRDHDECIKKGNPRFKVGDTVMAHRTKGYEKGSVIEVRENPTSTGYRIQMADCSEECVAPEDLSQFVRPVARFKKGSAVLARVGDGYLPGKIDAVYHPEWVYAVRLKDGNVVMAPEDSDLYVKKA